VETKFSTQSKNEHIPNFSDRLNEIQDILAEHDIPQRGVFVAYRVNDGTDITNCETTLVIVSEYKDGCQSNWVKAVSEIHGSLARHGIDQSIELIDERALGQLSVSPISSADRAVIKGWREVLPEVHALIRNQEYVAIDVLNREFPSREMQPTVIISARDANDDIWWDEIIPALTQLLQAKGVEIDIVLLYCQGLVF
jgi:hypothetical protein